MKITTKSTIYAVSSLFSVQYNGQIQQEMDHFHNSIILLQLPLDNSLRFFLPYSTFVIPMRFK